jgi:hypothetical protein
MAYEYRPFGGCDYYSLLATVVAIYDIERASLAPPWGKGGGCPLMMRHITLLITVVLMMAAMMAFSGAALAQAEPQREPFNTIFFSPCTEELILFEGFAQFIPQRVHRDQGGGLHGMAQGLNHGEGVGTISGDKYIFNFLSTGASTMRLDLDGTNTGVAVSSGSVPSTIIREGEDGSPDDLVGNAVFKFTTNANGELVVELIIENFECV